MARGLKIKRGPRLKHLVGIDEAGRGPLAGPVVVAVLKIDKDSFAFRKVARAFPEIKDSKQIPAETRKLWFLKIQDLKRAGVLDYRVSSSSTRYIDERGIMGGVRQALSRSLKNLSLDPAVTEIRLDGSLFAPKHFIYQKTIVRGDETERIIALASIVAKVHRDKIMERYAKKFPRYKFELHKGYGTHLHYKTIRKYGMSPIHRKTFLKTIQGQFKK